MKRGVKGALLHGKRASFVLRKMPFRQCVGSQRFGGLPLAAVRYSVGIGSVSPVTLFIPNRSLDRNVLISIVILLLLAVLCPSAAVFSSVPSRRSPLRLRQNGRKTVCHKYIIRLSSNDRFGFKGTNRQLLNSRTRQITLRKTTSCTTKYGKRYKG